MPKTREPIDDMIDAHVWMRRKESQLRPLTLDYIPDELLSEYALRRGAATEPSYRSTDPQSVLAPVAEITVPVRKLNEDALRSLLHSVRDGDSLPPVVMFRKPARPPRR